MIFDQEIPKGGFKEAERREDMQRENNPFARMKTDELRDAREKYLEAADEKKKLAKARDELNQFQEIKKILFNI